MARWHRDAGLDVVEFDGWQTRSRSSGGYDDVLAIQEHHDASSPKRTGRAAAEAHWLHHKDRPVGAISTDRDGVHWIGAAGATNTSGKGGPLRTSRGVIPKDQANRFVISRESANNGTGEPWSDVQLESIQLANAAIIHGLANDGAYDARRRDFVQIILNPAHPGDLHGHFEWTDRKIDPAGGKYAQPGDPWLRWDMNRWRRDVAARLHEEDDMTKLYVLWRDIRYANVFLVGPGGAVQVTPEQAKRYRAAGVPDVVERHDEAVKAYAAQSGGVTLVKV